MRGAGSLAAAAVMAVAFGCGGGGTSTGEGGAGGTSAGGSGGGAVVYRPCAAESRVGGFGVLLVENIDAVGPPYAMLSGRVRDGVDPITYLEAKASAGDCKLVARPICAPACARPELCGVGARCVREPLSRSVGTVDVTGLSVAVAGVPAIASQYTKDLSEAPFPPAAPGAPVTLRTSGGDYAPVTLTARGIEPLDFPGAGIVVTRGASLAVAWTPPAAGATGKVDAILNIAYHGGGSAEIECVFDDDGAAEIPAALIDQLIDQGTAGFPILSLNRRSVDSVALAPLDPPGCIEFAVSAYRERQITVCPQPGVCVISCGVGMPCPDGMACGNDKKCS